MMGSSPSLKAGLCSIPNRVCYLVVDAGEERLEPLLDVLDRLVDSAAHTEPRDSSEALAIKRGGRVFTQELYDVFCKDEKVYVLHDYYPRTLCDATVMDWFCLKSYLSRSEPSTRHLDPDGTFQQYTARICDDILLSLRLLAAELTLGLIFLRSRGIVHLDIQPGNISVTSTGHVQICNFTMAVALPNLLPRQAGPDLSDLGSINNHSNTITDLLSDSDCETGPFGTITLDSKAIVTSKYAAPELLEPDNQGKIAFDSKSDWWSLGMILLELAYNTEDHNVMPAEGDFADFLCQTLSKDPQKRLAGFAAQSHSFFGFDADTWDDILDLHHPPCPAVREAPLSDLSCDQDASEFIPTYQADRDSLIQASQGHGLAPDVDVGEENQQSEVQPFPSTASLYLRVDINPDASVLEYRSGNKSLVDFGPALEDSVSSSVCDLEYDEDDSIIIIRSPCYDSRVSCVSDYVDWKEMLKGDNVTLPQVADGKTLVLDNRDDLRGYKRFNRKRLAHTIAKSSERVMNRVSRYIFTAFKC